MDLTLALKSDPNHRFTLRGRFLGESSTATNHATQVRIGRQTTFDQDADHVVKPKVVHILDGRCVDGAESLTGLITSQLKDHYHFSAVCIGGHDRSLADLQRTGAPVHVVKRRPGLDWRCSRHLASILRLERADLVHAHQAPALFYAMLSRLHYATPVILLTEHERPHPDLPSPRRASLYKMLLESRDRIVAVSRNARKALILNEGLPPEQVSVVYNGVATPEVRPASDVRSHRAALGLHADSLLILQVAPFELNQNHVLSIQAMKQVARLHPEARLILVGVGPEQELIRNLVAESELLPFVQFLGNRPDIATLVRASDLVLSTSLVESVSPVVYQALAAGRPVVATRVGALPEVVEDRVCGLLANPGDYGGLADLLVRLGRDPGLRETFGQHGRMRAARMFSVQETLDAYAQLYKTMTC